MQFKSKGVLIALVAVFVMSAVASASASASSPEWFVAGHKLVGSEPVAEKTKVEEAFTIKDGTLSYECSSLALSSADLAGEMRGSAAALTFSMCKVVGNAKCEVGAGDTFKTKPVALELEGAPPEPQVKIVPETGTEFATLKVGGDECGVKGEYKLKGQLTADLVEAATARAEHELRFTSASSGLEFGSEKVTFTGGDAIGLTSGRTWDVQ